MERVRPVPVTVVDVPFDGYGRPGHQAAAGATLRAAGLLASNEVPAADRAAAPDPQPSREWVRLDLPPPEPTRGAVTTFINEPALLAMMEQVSTCTATLLGAGRFPVIVGGDCAHLLGTVPGARSVHPDLGLVFIDGHEDTTPVDVSEDGEAASSELGLLLGLTGRTPGFPLAGVGPPLGAERVAVLGPRDHVLRRSYNLGSLEHCVAFYRDATSAAADPAVTGADAVGFLGAGAQAWWMHIDLDVLDPIAMPAAAVPGDPGDPGGLTRSQLTTIACAAAARGGCVGLSIALYDPELDRDRECARTIVALVHRILDAVDSGPGRVPEGDR